MYEITCDNEVLYDARLEERLVLSPILNLEVGKNGTLSFKIPVSNPFYNKIQQKLSILKVYQVDKIDNKTLKTELFRGNVYSEKIDFYKRKQVECEGELSFFCDSVVRPYSYQGDVENLFKQYVHNHNNQVDSSKKFIPRKCTVIDNNDYITRANINYPTSKDEMDEKLIDILGGHFESGENKDGSRYIDYLAEYEKISGQTIEFGKNELDITQYIKSEDVATRIIPLGKKDDETGEYLTIKSVNNGLDYIQDDAAVALFGIIEKKVIFDDITLPQNLLAKGKITLQEKINKTVSIEVSAADLHNLNVNIDAFRIGQYVRVISKPHGLDKYFLLSKLHLVLDNLSKCKLTLGAVFKTLTQKQIEREKNINNVSNTIITIQDEASVAQKTADTANNRIDNIFIDISKDYVSIADFNEFKSQITKKIASVFTVKGSVESFSVLELLTDKAVGDVYNCLDTGANYVFTDAGWDKLSETIDLSSFVDKATFEELEHRVENLEGE